MTHGAHAADVVLPHVWVDSLRHQQDLVLCVAWALPTGQDLDATTLVGALGT
ncbi:hypothetical protein KIF24_31500 [Micromonospora sp. Llam7]|uniref:hypothetical protein n=1 Tax=Micromonospora tarapacensis TaxID=2835305 RepID=UPI001C83F304|nr:hypothetical protein [Micromonospora tarapacensis]MBX7270102.1 hypothetical protein [Micromonospora tarapacensis]